MMRYEVLIGDDEVKSDGEKCMLRKGKIRK
jgi:hypothetical protein